MKYLSVCSGIEAASCAWHPLGWEPLAFSEVDSFPSSVLAHHYPTTPNYGDMTKFKEWPDADVDVLVGGTPCQSFSVAGLRKGLADPRGNLMLTYLAIADKYRPRWLVWENVPGVLSSGGGRDFGTFLGGLGQLGYGFAYRVLDAQFIRVESHLRAVPQRRRRVFVIGYFGDWRRAAAVLLERESMSGYPAPRREAGQGSTYGVAPSLTSSGRGVERTGETRGQDPVVAMCLNAGGQGRQDSESETLIPTIGGGFDVAHSLKADGFDASEDGTGRGTPLTLAIRGRGDSYDLEYRQDGTANAVLTPNGGRGGIGVGAIAIQGAATRENVNSGPDGIGVRSDGASFTLEARSEVQAIAFSCKDHAADADSIAPTLRGMGHDGSHANGGGQVAVAFQSNMNANDGVGDGVAPTMRVGTGVGAPTGIAVAFAQNQRDEVRTMHVAGALASEPGMKQQTYARVGMQVRRLTPMECERLQGFPDGYTDVPHKGKSASDGGRYKALGNSMAVNCMSWLGQRIAMVDAL